MATKTATKKPSSLFVPKPVGSPDSAASPASKKSAASPTSKDSAASPASKKGAASPAPGTIKAKPIVLPKKQKEDDIPPGGIDSDSDDDGVPTQEKIVTDDLSDKSSKDFPLVFPSEKDIKKTSYYGTLNTTAAKNLIAFIGVVSGIFNDAPPKGKKMILEKIDGNGFVTSNDVDWFNAKTLGMKGHKAQFGMFTDESNQNSLKLVAGRYQPLVNELEEVSSMKKSASKKTAPAAEPSSKKTAPAAEPASPRKSRADALNAAAGDAKAQSPRNATILPGVGSLPPAKKIATIEKPPKIDPVVAAPSPGSQEKKQPLKAVPLTKPATLARSKSSVAIPKADDIILPDESLKVKITKTIPQESADVSQLKKMLEDQNTQISHLKKMMEAQNAQISRLTELFTVHSGNVEEHFNVLKTFFTKKLDDIHASLTVNDEEVKSVLTKKFEEYSAGRAPGTLQGIADADLNNDSGEDDEEDELAELVEEEDELAELAQDDETELVEEEEEDEEEV